MINSNNNILDQKPTTEDVQECLERLTKGVNVTLASHQKRARTFYNNKEIDADAQEHIFEEIEAARKTFNSLLDMFENCEVKTYKQLKDYEDSINNVIESVVMGIVELIELKLADGRNQEI